MCDQAACVRQSVPDAGSAFLNSSDQNRSRTYSASMEIVLEYVKDRAAAAHIWDYIRERPDHALCGHPYVDPVVLDGPGRPRAVCRACQDQSPRVEALLWRAKAEEFEEVSTEWESFLPDYECLHDAYESLWKEYDGLYKEYEKLVRHSDNQRREIRNLRAKLSPGTPTRKQPRKHPEQVDWRPKPPRRIEFPYEPPRKRPRVTLRR